MFNFHQIPSYFVRYLSDFHEFFTKPQLNNFIRFVSGLVLSERKNIQEINSVYGDKDQSSLNRFVTCSSFDLSKINSFRLQNAEKSFGSEENGFLILDDTMAIKTGKKMEKVNYHKSGVTGKIELGHCFVDMIYSDSKTIYPIDITSYLRAVDADKMHPFKTKREIALDQIDFACANGVKAGNILADAWYYSVDFLKEIISRWKKYFIGTKSNVKISIDKKKRISIKEYYESLKNEDFSEHQLENGLYFLHSVNVTVRGLGKQVLLISYKKGEQDNVKYVFTNQFNWANDSYIIVLIKRWNIECFHRDMKQHLGLEEYQVRKYSGMQVVALAVLLAYTLLTLNANHKLLEKTRPLETIGEMCRFAKLYAQRSTYWMKKTFADPAKAARILNQLVLVKNAKV